MIFKICVIFFLSGFVSTASFSASVDKGNKGTTGVGLITNNSKSHFNISRLQIRLNDQGGVNFTQSIFYRFPNEMFIAQAYEHRTPVNTDPDFNFFVWNIGGKIATGSAVGWVARGQYATQSTDTYSIGLQYSLSSIDQLRDFKKKHKLTLFIQLFPLKSNNEQGQWDLLFYDSFSVYGKLYMRGNTTFIKYKGDKNYIRSFHDLVYPINKKFDIYARIDYQNRSDVQFGKQGVESSVGFRFNFSF